MHQLKTVEPYFAAVVRGDKTFEVRKFDRDYQIGDFLDLVHYNPETNQLGKRVTRRITYMLTDQPYVPEGYVILGMVDDVIAIPF
ncbi:RNA-binding protein [Bacillus sp. T33-2]|nr:RNA-binding protein [Bacillus sp. T33-2]